MGALEKYRDYSLISRLMAYVLFFDAGTSLLKMFINMIRYGFGNFSIWTIVYQSVPVIAGLILLNGKHNDKMFRLAFPGALVLTKLIAMVRIIFASYATFKSILFNFTTLALAAGFALYYLGVIRPAGRKNFFIVMYAIMGVEAIFAIFMHYSSSNVALFGMCAIMAMYDYQETRADNSTMVYAGMIGTAYYMVYSALSSLLSLFYVSLPSFFSSMNILLCLAMPLLVYDRVVPGEGAPFTIDFGALTNMTQPAQYNNQQPMQQNGFAQPMQGQYQQPVQPMPQQTNAPGQNNFDPMTGQPLNPQPPVQNNFDPMTGQPIQPQQNRFDPMTGKPIDPNNGQ